MDLACLTIACLMQVCFTAFSAYDIDYFRKII